jgi:hypothetical protein
VEISCFKVSNSQRESFEEADATEPAVLGGSTLGMATMTASDPESDILACLWAACLLLVSV